MCPSGYAFSAYSVEGMDVHSLGVFLGPALHLGAQVWAMAQGAFSQFKVRAPAAYSPGSSRTNHGGSCTGYLSVGLLQRALPGAALEDYLEMSVAAEDCRPFSSWPKVCQVHWACPVSPASCCQCVSAAIPDPQDERHLEALVTSHTSMWTVFLAVWV